MSRLIDKFQQAAKSSVQPMGFHTSKTAAPPSGFLLITRSSPDVLKNHNDIADADAVLIKAEGEMPGPKYIEKIIQAVGKTPAGLYMPTAWEDENETLTKAGCDFFVFNAAGRYVAAPSGEKRAGRILEIESSMDDMLLRSLNALPVDAFYLTDTYKGGALTWKDLLNYQRLALLCAKPLIVNLPPAATEAEIKALYEAGIDGAMVEACNCEEGSLPRLREIIKKLPPNSARKRGKTDVSLPRAGGAAPAAPPDEEEEDE